MQSLVLVPYCPLPIDTGAKVEMWKHLDILLGMGTCRIVSARRRPVGLGWLSEYEESVRFRGFELVFRENFIKINTKLIFGYFYGILCKGFRANRAFGHSNPYHRYAFSGNWWFELTKQADIAVINYSYWAHLPCACPKVVILHDLISNFSWEKYGNETKELQSADLVVSISQDEENLLRQRGVRKTLWSPPLVSPVDLPLTGEAGVVGSDNKFNISGLRWMERGRAAAKTSIRVYGRLAHYAVSDTFHTVGCYDDPLQPYKDCGIILLPTTGGTGVQIKAVEALAAGRIIVARKGALRGLPPGDGAWIEVECPEEMFVWVKRLQADSQVRRSFAKAAKTYYSRHLEALTIERNLQGAYASLVR